jgi:serine/threonine protein kinase
MRTVSRCPDRRQLEGYVLGTLSPPQKLRVKNHVGQCDACQTALRGLSPEAPTRIREDDSAWEVRIQSGPDLTAPTRYPFLLPAVGPDEIGRLGNYRVLRLLGQGGMAFVFLAEDIALGREVALKVMKPELQELGGWERFLREARLLAASKHEHLVTIYQAGQQDNVNYFAMELLQGESLADRLDRSPRTPVAEILRLGREIASGLGFLHGKGLLHRDVKPANIWLEEPHGRVKILDLGLARPVREVTGLTRPDLIVGTPGYMSPEQARGEALDARTDLFSLGCVLYETCTGAAPFTGTTALALLTALAVDDPRPVREANPEVPERLAGLVARLLAKSPEDRPPSAAAILEEFERIERELQAPPPLPEPPHEARVQAPPTRKLEPLSDPRIQAQPTRRVEMPTPAPSRSGGKRLGAALALGVAFLAAFLGAGVVSGLLSVPFLEATGSAPARPAPNKVYVCDLPVCGQEHWPFFPPPHPNGERPGEVIRVRGKVSPNGIFMHPPPLPVGAASASYRLRKGFSTFRARVSLNDGPPRSASACTFLVYGDGVLLWKSAPVREQADAQTCAISVKGVEVLRLAVSCAGPPFGAHAVWIEPYVAK